MEIGITKTNTKTSSRKQLAALMAALMLLVFAFVPALAQTEPPGPGQAWGTGQDPQLGQNANGTDPTNQYMYNQKAQTTLVQEQAEQNTRAVAQNVEEKLWPAFGAYNDTYAGLSAFWGDDIISNFFANIGQLIGKWLSEFINGWVADAVQFLTGFLRIFVLNPNIAVNGLSASGGPADDISPYIRQGADIMYSIAVDLLLLLFILCIWKFWAEAAWRGGGNMMGAVGRLIFTAGLLLAWPTIYAFEIQITNEMIGTIFFKSQQEIAMLDAAMASAVKAGLVAGAGLLANATAPVAGQVFGGLLGGGPGGLVLGTVGYLVAFVGLIVYLIVGGILIAELIYILILKAIQTALLCAQYMFAPFFLVWFALPDTENVATGFVRSFVEVSLWTFVWVGMLRIFSIVVLSDFNPWGKIIMAIGVLQLMIQVPSFLARAQISPMSDFISAGLVTGGLLSAGKALGNQLSSRAMNFANMVGNFGYAGAKGAPKSQMVGLNGLPSGVANQDLKDKIDQTSKTGKAPGQKPEGPVDKDGKPIVPPKGPNDPNKDKDKDKKDKNGMPVPPAGKDLAAEMAKNKAGQEAGGLGSDMASAAKAGLAGAGLAGVAGAAMAATGAANAGKNADGTDMTQAQKAAAALEALKNQQNMGIDPATGKPAIDPKTGQPAVDANGKPLAAGAVPPNKDGKIDQTTGKPALDASGKPLTATGKDVKADAAAAAGLPGATTAKVNEKGLDGKGAGTDVASKNLAPGINPEDVAKQAGELKPPGAGAGAGAGKDGEMQVDVERGLAAATGAGAAASALNALKGVQAQGQGDKAVVPGQTGVDPKGTSVKGAPLDAAGNPNPNAALSTEAKLVSKPGTPPVAGAGDKQVTPLGAEGLKDSVANVNKGIADPTIKANPDVVVDGDPGAPLSGVGQNKVNPTNIVGDVAKGAAIAATAAGAANLATKLTQPTGGAGDNKQQQPVLDAQGRVIPSTAAGANNQAVTPGQTSDAQLVQQQGKGGLTPPVAGATGNQNLEANLLDDGPAPGIQSAATGGNAKVTAQGVSPGDAAKIATTAAAAAVVAANKLTPPPAGTVTGDGKQAVTDAQGRIVGPNNAAANAAVTPGQTTDATLVQQGGRGGGLTPPVAGVTGNQNLEASLLDDGPAPGVQTSQTAGTAKVNATGVNPSEIAKTATTAAAAAVVAANAANKLTPPVADNKQTTLDAQGRVVGTPIGTGSGAVTPGLQNAEAQITAGGQRNVSGAPTAGVRTNQETSLLGEDESINANPAVTTDVSGQVIDKRTAATAAAVGAAVNSAIRSGMPNLPPAARQAAQAAQANQTVQATLTGSGAPSSSAAGSPTALPPESGFTQARSSSSGTPPSQRFAGGVDGGGGGGDDGGGDDGGTGGITPPPPPIGSGSSTGSPKDIIKDHYQSGYMYVPGRVAQAAIRLAQGATVGSSRGGTGNHVIMDSKGQVMHYRYEEGATPEQKAMGILSGSYAELMSSDSEAYDSARMAAINAGEHKPQGAMERMAAGILAYNGSSWTQTAAAKQRFARSMSKHAAIGAQAYVNGGPGNEYTEFLVNRYGEMNQDQQAWAVHMATNPESPESGWNWKLQPATDALIQNGIGINALNRASAANTAVLKAQPWLRGAAIRGTAAYVSSKADAVLPADTHPMVRDAWYGSNAPSIDPGTVNCVGALTLATGSEDVCKDFRLVDSVVAMAGPGAKPDDYVGAYTAMTGGANVIRSVAVGRGPTGSGGGGTVNMGSQTMSGGGSSSGSMPAPNVTTNVSGSVVGGGGGSYNAEMDLLMDGPSQQQVNPNQVNLGNLPPLQTQGGATNVDVRMRQGNNPGGNLGNMSMSLPGGNVGSSQGQVQVGNVYQSGGQSGPSTVGVDVEIGSSGAPAIDMQQAAVQAALSYHNGDVDALNRSVIAELRANDVGWDDIANPNFFATAVESYGNNPNSAPQVAIASQAVGPSRVSAQDVAIVQQFQESDPRWSANNIDYASIYTAKCIQATCATEPQTFGTPYLTKDLIDSVRLDPGFRPETVPQRGMGGQVVDTVGPKVPRQVLLNHLQEQMKRYGTVV